jgi:hypothetical protein
MDVHVTADHLDLLVIYLLMGAGKCADHRTPYFALVHHDGPDMLAVTYLPMVGKCVTPLLLHDGFDKTMWMGEVLVYRAIVERG